MLDPRFYSARPHVTAMVLTLDSEKCFKKNIFPIKNIARSKKAAQSTSHTLSRCQIDLTNFFFKGLSKFEFCKNLSFRVLSQLEFLSFFLAI